MLTISCSACQRKLSVKEELAGKKVKCPGCGAITPVPAPVAAASSSAEQTGAFVPSLAGNGEEQATVAQTREDADASAMATSPAASKPDATQGIPADSGHDAALTDFLAPPQSPDELGRLGKYRILKILGHGGMGAVFLGEDPMLGRHVAIKVMLPHLASSRSSIQRFLREAKTAAKVEHDNIVPIFQVDEDRGAPYIVMPLLKGEPLDDRLKNGPPLAVADILRIGRETAKGLDAAHRTGLIHRDIKPANLWLEAPEARVKILDFGLARVSSDEAGLTQQGAVVGTPAYMSPEQARGEAVDARGDLFSLGVVLYRMATGQQPFRGKDALSTLVAIERDTPAPPIALNKELPPALSELVMKLLEKDRDKRMQSAGDVVKAIQAIEKKLAAEEMAEATTETMDAGDVKHGIKKGEPSRAKTGEPSRVSGRVPPQPGPSRGSARPLIAVALVAVLGFIGLLAGGGIYYWQTNNGLVRIEINDPGIKVAFDRNGPTISGVDKHDIKLTPGEFGLTVERGDLKFDTDKFILKRGETITLKIEWLKDGKLQVVQGDRVIGKALAKNDVAVGPPAGADYALSLEPEDSVELPSLRIDSAGPFTIEAYVRNKKAGLAGGKIFGQGGYVDLSRFSEGTWCFQCGAPGRAEFVKVEAADARFGEKTHVAAVRSGDDFRLFVDGKLVASKKSALPLNGFHYAKYFLGKQGNTPNRAIAGIIDEVRISKVARYSKDFTPQKRFEPDADTLALYHMDEGAGDKLTDSSGNGHHGKIVGAKWVKADRSPMVPSSATARKYALHLDSDGKAWDSVRIHTLIPDFSQPCTVEAFVTARSEKGTGYPFLCDGGAGSVSCWLGSWQLGFWGEHSTGKREFVTKTGTVQITIGKSTHLALVSTGRQYRLYVDGVLSAEKDAGDLSLSKNKVHLTLGRDFTGEISEIRVSKIVRYDKEFVPQKRFEPDADTLALYHCDEGSGDVLKDSSGNGHHGKIAGAKWVKADGTPIAPPAVSTPLPRFALSLGNEGAVNFARSVTDKSVSFTLEGWWLIDPPLEKVPPNSPAFLLGTGGGAPYLGFARSLGKFYFSQGKYRLHSQTDSYARWVHVAGVREGKEIRLFIDGKLAATQSADSEASLGLTPEFNVKGGAFATVKEVRISKIARYAKDFSPAQRFEPDADTLALYHCDEGSGDVLKDSSGKGHHGKIVGAKWVKVDGTPVAAAPTNQYALLFDEDARVPIDSVRYDLSLPHTYEAFVTPITRGARGIIGSPGHSGIGANNSGWTFNIAPLDPKEPRFLFGQPFVLGQKAHVAGVYADGMVRLFVDGKLVSEAKSNGLKDAKGGLFQIGGPKEKASFVVSEVRISKVGRYTKPFTPAQRFEPDAHTLALYHCDEGSGDVLKDSSGNGHHGKIVGAKWVKADGTPISAATLQEEWAAKAKLPVEVTNKIGMKLRLIPPGDDVTDAFYVGKFEVTQEEWQRVMEQNPSVFGPKHPKTAGMDTSKFPVENVNWFDCIEFCNKLSERENRKPYYEMTAITRKGNSIEEANVKIVGGNGYHIPTAAQWSRACQADAKTKYYFGDNEDDLPEYEWFAENSDGRTHAVGGKKPNPFGLYDILGNVQEWNEEPQTGKKGPARLFRGGNWMSTPKFCTVWARYVSFPVSFSNGGYGLRVVRGADADQSFTPLFNGKDLTGWKVMGHPGWSVKDGVLVGESKAPTGWLMSDKDYADFELSLEYKQGPGGNSGVFLRAWPEGPVGGSSFMEIQLIDDAKAFNAQSKTGALFQIAEPNPAPKATVNEWHRLDIRLQGRQLQVTFDDQKILVTNLDDHKAKFTRFPGLTKTTGRIGLQLYPGKVEFKNIRVRELGLK